MADNAIVITRAGHQMATDFCAALDQLQRAKQTLERLKANMDQQTDAQTWTTLETHFGIPAGKGDEVYNLTAGAIAELQADTNVGQLLSWIVPA